LEIDELIEKLTREVSEKIGPRSGTTPGFKEVRDLSSTLEYSMLNPDTTEKQLVAAFALAKKQRLANVCVSPYYTSLAAGYMRNSGVAVCVPVGFPHGAASTAAKAAEIREAVKNGATEFDVEMNILAIKSGCFDEAERDLAELVNLAKGKAVFKAIYEQGLLTEEERVKTLKMADACGVDYIKISNALTGKNACAEDVRFVRGIVAKSVGIKIDGGIRSAKTALELLKAGANRFGVSKPEQILSGE
jgi:deoxyribose-phosphate aldolase